LKEELNSNVRNKLFGLDHLRALAIILVFFFHYQILSLGNPQWLPPLAKFGWTGVDLFFVLSGFLISSQLFSEIKKGKGISFVNFFRKRFFRIIPAFIVVLLIYFWFPAFHEKESLPPIWRFLTFTQNFGLNIKDHGTFSHFWSLCVEEHFYFLLPITLILLQRTNSLKKSYWIIIVLFLFGFIIRNYSWANFYLPKIGDEDSWIYWYKYIYYPTYNRLDGLLIGVSIAGIYNFLPVFWHKISRYGNQFILLSLLVLTGAYFLCYTENSYAASIFGFPVVALGYGFMVLGAISPTSFLYKWNSKITTFIATLSYSIYLTHKGIIHIVQHLFVNLHIGANSSLMLLICMLFCILGALVLNITVEKPFMKLRGR